MNQTFKTIWNTVRGQLVVVNEATAGHAQAGGAHREGSAVLTKDSGLMRHFSAALLTVAVLSCFAGAPQAAVVTDVADSWGITDGSVDTDDLDFEMKWAGGTFGATAPLSDAYNVRVLAGGSYVGGTYDNDKDYGLGFIGTQYQTGIFYAPNLYNLGTLSEVGPTVQKDDGSSVDQIAATYWLKGFYNDTTGNVDIGHVRIGRELSNKSANFKIASLLLNKGATIANDGVMEVGDLTTGVGNGSLFTNRALSAQAPDLQLGADAAGSFKNSGTVKVTGTFTNYVALTDDTTGIWTVKTWDNHADAALKTVTAETLTHAAGKTFTADTLGVTDALTNLGSITAGALTLKTVDNQGTLSSGAGALTATGVVTNQGTITGGAVTVQTLNNTAAASALTATGALIVNDGLTNAAGAQVTGDTASLTGTTTNAGSITATNGVAVSGSLTNSGTLVAGTKLTALSGSKVALAGTASADALDIQTAEVTISSKDVTVGTLTSSGASKLTNDQTLALTSIGATEGLTYNQTAGSISTADNSWFSKATLNISGGSITRTAAGANTLGTNTVNISGATPLNAADGTQLGTGWDNGQTIVEVGLLDSNATVSLGTGGLLKAVNVGLTSQSLTFNGGALATSLDQMFQGVAAATYTITTGEDGHLATKVLGAESVDSISEDFKNNIVFGAEGGTLVVTDQVVSVKAITQSSAALKAVAGNAADKVSVVYTGRTSAGGGSTSQIFTQQTFDDLKAEQQTMTGSKFVTPGLVFATMTYENAATEGGATRTNLVVGTKPDTVPGDAYYLDNSIGFKNVTGAESVTVKDGLEFTLMGDTTNEIALVAGGNTASATGTGTVLSLGNAGVTGTKGRLAQASIADGAALKVKNGAYTVDTVSDAAGTTVDVESGAALTVTNGGTLAAAYANRGSFTQSGTAAISGTFANEGTANFAGDANTLTGTFTNKKGTATFKTLAMSNTFTTEKDAKTVFENGFTMSAAMKGAKAYTNNGRTVSKGAGTLTGAQFIAAADSATVLDGATTIERQAVLRTNGDAYVKTASVKTGSTLQVGPDTLFVTEEFTGDATSRLVLGANSTVAAYAMKNRGTQLSGQNVRLAIGDVAAYDLLTDPDSAFSTRITTLLGNDAQLRDPSATTSTSSLTYTGDELAAAFFAAPRMRSVMRTMAYAAPLADFSATIPAPDAEANQYAGGDVTTQHVISGTKYDKDGNLLTDTPSVEITGNVNVQKGGTLTGYDDVYVNNGVTVTVADGGAAKFAATTDSHGDLRATRLLVNGAIDVAQGGTLAAESLVLKDGGSFTNAGRAGGDKLLLSENSILQTADGSETTFAAADLQGGDIVVKGGYLGFGLDATTAKKATSKAAVLGLGLTALDASKAAVQVGTLAPDTTLAAGDLYFGSDSALVLATTQLGEAAAVKGAGRLTVKKGSELSVVSASWGKHVLVTDGYDLSGMDDGAWQGADFKNLSGKALTLDVESGKLVLTAGSESIKDSNMDMSASGVIDGLIGNVEEAQKRDVESRYADVRFVARVLEDEFGGTDAEKQKTWNSVAQLGAASGFDAYVFDESTNLLTTIEGRATGSAAAAPAAQNGLFAQVLGRTTEADGLEAGAGFEGGYDADSYGILAGFESAFGSGFKAGVALAYVDGDLDGKGDFAKTSTDAKVWGGLGYVGYAFDSGWQVTGHAGLLKASGDVSQSIASSMGFGKATADLDSLTFGLGIRADKTFDFGVASVTPHAGLRWVMTKADGYDVQLDGEKAFTTDDETTNVVQVPVGVTVAGAFDSGSWNIKPYADLTVTANAGDTDRETKLRAVNYSGADAFSADVAGNVTGEFTLGVQGGTDAFGFRLGASALAGDAGRRSYGVTGSVEWKF